MVWLAASAGWRSTTTWQPLHPVGGQPQRPAKDGDALDASIQIARALGTETDVDTVLALVAKRGRALVGARVLLIEALDGCSAGRRGAGEFDTRMIGERVALAETVASVALRTEGASSVLRRPEPDPLAVSMGSASSVLTPPSGWLNRWSIVATVLARL